MALKALSASESGQAPDALAVQNVTFLGLGDQEVVDFLATARQWLGSNKFFATGGPFRWKHQQWIGGKNLHWKYWFSSQKLKKT